MVRRAAAGAVVAAALAIGAAGCTMGRYYTGAPLRADPSSIREGESTKADVLRLLGPPQRIEHQTDGDVFVYVYQRENFASFTVQEPFSGQRLFTYNRSTQNNDRIVVLFDFFGVVRGVAAENQTGDMGWL